MNSKPDSFDYDVFISYSHRDNDWVWNWLVPRLKQAELKVCIDHECFEPGEPLLKAMERAVQTSCKTLLVLTPNYIDSDWCEFESILVRTLDPPACQRRAIPLVLQHCDLPPSIGMLTRVDFSQPKSRGRELRRLVAAIHSDCGSGKPRPKSPTTWWEAVGFTSNPFAYRDATREDIDKLSRYFVYPPQWGEIEGNPASPDTAIVVAANGMGKTANCRFLKYRCDSGYVGGKQVLAVLCTEQDVVSGDALSLKSHWTLVSRIVLKELMIRLETDPGRIKELGKAAQGELAQLLRVLVPDFLDPLNVDDTFRRMGLDLDYSSLGKTEEWDERDRSPEAFPMVQFLQRLVKESNRGYDKEQSPKRAFDRITRIVDRLGWESLYILIDEADEQASRKDGAEKWVNFLEDMSNERFPAKSVGVKIFICPETWKCIESRGNVTWNGFISIELPTASLEELLKKRLQECSEKARFSSLKPISEDQAGDVDAWLIRESGRCPANLLHLGNELFYVMNVWWHALGREEQANELRILPEFISLAWRRFRGQHVTTKEIEEEGRKATAWKRDVQTATLPQSLPELERKLREEFPTNREGLARFGRLWAQAMREWKFNGKINDPRAKVLAEAYNRLTDELWRAYCTSLDHELHAPSGLHKLDCKMTTSVFDEALEVSADDQLAFVLVIDAMSWMDWVLCEDALRVLSKRLGPPEADVRVAVVPTQTPVALTCLLTGFLPGELGLCGWKYVNTDRQQVNLYPLDDARGPRKDVRENSQAVERDFGGLKSKANREFTWFVVKTWAKRQSAFLTGLIFQLCPKIGVISLKKSEPPGVWDELVERIEDEEFKTKLVVIYLDYFDEQSHQKEKPSATAIEMYYKEEEEVIGRILEAIEKRAASRGESYSVVITADHGKFTQFERDALGQIMDFTWTDSRKAHLAGKMRNHFAPLTGAIDPETTAKTYAHWIHDAEIADVHAFLRDEWGSAPDVIFKVGEDVGHMILGNPPLRIRLPNAILLSKYAFTRRIFSDHGGISLSEMLVPFVRYRITGA